MTIKQTKWEKELIASGCPIITWDHEVIMEYLLSIYHRDYAHLLSVAMLSNQPMRNLTIILDFEDGFRNRTNFGGTVNYNKKLRRFTTITYSDRYNYAVEFSITSKVAFFSRDWYMQLKHVFPFGGSQKNITHYLMHAL